MELSQVGEFREDSSPEGGQALEQAALGMAPSCWSSRNVWTLLSGIWSDFLFYFIFFVWSCVEPEVGLDVAYESLPIWDVL